MFVAKYVLIANNRENKQPKIERDYYLYFNFFF